MAYSNSFDVLGLIKSWIKAGAEALKPTFVEMRDNAPNTGPGVLLLGFSGSSIAGVGVTGGISLLLDNKGNVVIQGTLGGGGGFWSPASGSFNAGWYPDAPDSYSIGPKTNQMGVAYGGSPRTNYLTVGYDRLESTSDDGTTYGANQISLGFSNKAPLNYDYHDFETSSRKINDFNIYDTMANIYHAIKDW